MILVAGFSGIGKTAIVREVHKPIVRARGYFISGKFEQFQRNIPFFALVQAFRDLIQQLLTESEERIDRFRAELLAVLGKDGRVIIDVIPEVELLIGSQPPVVKLEGTAAQNRFNLLFSKFVRVFTAAERPLVIFLDDLQWADSASLKLIQLLVGQTESGKQGGLLFIGAYRDNEVGPGHPLVLALEEIRQQGDRDRVSQITLGPLNLNSLNELVADTLNCSPELALPLTQLVRGKTQGNPFFATQFLKSLYEDGLISFVWGSAEDTDGGYWQCDIAKVRGLAVSDDVVEFMASQLRRLGDGALLVLKIAACIGNQFDLATLAIACDKSPEATAAALWKPLQEGLILPGSKIYKFFQGELGDRDPLNSHSFTGEKLPSISYKFLHDRVQQAAYFLIPEDEKKSTHLKIGQLLLAHASSEELEAQIFPIVNQLNLGRELIIDSQNLEELSRLNLQAGRKALESTARVAAKEYLNIGLELLPQNSWQTQYELTLELHELAAAAAYLNGDFDRAQTLIALVIERGQNVLDKISVYETQIQIYAAQNQMQAAVDAGLEILDILGVNWVEEPPPKLSTEELYNLPNMTDAEKEAALRILTNIQAPLYHANPQRLGALAFTMVHLCIEYGNCPTAAYAYAFYGFIRCLGMSDFEGGHQLGQLSLQMLDKFDCRDIQAKVINIFNCFIRHWKEHSRETIVPLKDNVQTGLENGDLEYTAYASFNYCHNSVLIGANLDSLSQEVEHYLALLRKIKQEFQLEATQVWGELVLNLKGEKVRAETSLLENPRGNPMSLYSAYHAKSYLAYLFEDYENAVAFCAEAEKYQGAMASLLPVAQNPFYYSLSLLAKVPTPDLDRFLEAAENLALNEELTEVLTKVNSYQEKMKMWADNAPMNFQHKYDLVEAEKRRVLGKTAEAIAYYERAIAGAKNNGYIQEEALANELAAKFYLAWNKPKVAQGYFIDAYYCYSRWGATAKVRDLERKYRQYLTPILERETFGLSLEQTISKMTDGTVTSIGGTATIANLLNLSTAIKAARSLSEEIELDSLLTKLMQVMMENAGAQSGLLLLRESKQWLLAAHCANSTHCQILLSPIVIGSPEPIENAEGLDCLPQGTIDYVSRTQKTLVFDNASAEKMFESEPYIVKYQPQSVLCMPLIDRGKLIAILYLENKQLVGAFTKDRLEIIEMLSSQAVISIENARLYQKAQQALEELKVAQLQLVQSEKMSALGNLVAGVAHEINNPVGFISGNLEYARNYLQDLFDLIGLYEEKYPSPETEIEEKMAEIELDYLRQDFFQLLASLQQGTNTLQHISNSLRTFSRGDKDRKIEFDLHEGIDSSLLILKHRLKAKENRSQINVIKNYAELPKIKCFPGQLNQVFMNLLANAIDALDEGAEIKPGLKQIEIKTQMEGDRLKISITDNGIGMSEEVKKRIFEQGFTTKAVGKGTGLGMAIARQIVEEKHGGKIICTSEVGKGTEFAIFLPLN